MTNLNKIFYTIIFLFLFVVPSFAQPTAKDNLVFNSLAQRWDEAIPLGNGWLGALVWQKENKLRLSLDRVDLWDDRPMPEIDKLKFRWVTEQVKKGAYDTVQEIGDAPYDTYPAPTKIPGAALEFETKSLGKVISNVLDIKTAVNTIRFENGAVIKNYIHATNEIGYFSFENCNEAILPEIKIPSYHSGSKGTAGNTVEGQGLERLGYTAGAIEKGNNFLRYHQPTYNGGYYEVLVQWIKAGKGISGEWTITKNKKAVLSTAPSSQKITTAWNTHVAWWSNYWSRSSVVIPDTVINKQYYLELYKFGSVARANTPPISLQAIWTADNGNLPPWKGDLHHDLNTELSYWPGYASNHLDLTSSFTNWLWKVKPENERWTKQYFDINGLNIPGVSTISGKPMGGWIQYAMSPTIIAWMTHHYYWQWKYSMDEQFLKERCKPYFDAVQNYFSKLRVQDTVTKKYKLPLSSTPEYNDNSINAWFSNFTNFDLALVKSFNSEYADVCRQTGDKKLSSILADGKLYPALNSNETGLTIAPGQNLDESHRHHSHLLALYPLNLLNTGDEADALVIDKSLRWLEKKGTRAWCGYSFSWAACLYARAKEADNAAKMLSIFANNFVSINSFHLNGDQHGGKYSGFTYRPFTLEGNFAFAQGVHEMLVQSSKGYIEIFPATPVSWKNVSFNTLRTEGAFLVSAKKENGTVDEVTVKATADGIMKLQLPFKTFFIAEKKKAYQLVNDILSMQMKKGETVIIKNGFE